ncbi:MAG: agmatinase [Eubacteriales bacterium]|nr:agmatinase [Eubacteriales bacterium]
MNHNVFIGCDKEYKDAGIVLFGAPFDGTASFRPGARFAPQAMRLCSDGIETYSPYQNKDLSDISVCDIGDLEFPFGEPQAVLDIIEQKTAAIVSDEKLPVMIGGEHLVSLGAVRALAQKYSGLHVIHLDAHADLRNEYLGQKLSHATVMRRIWDILGDGRIFQYGIRSGDREEILWGRHHVHTRMFNCGDIEHAVKKTQDMPVYLSIDLDVLDSSVLPGTGTPEAGGIGFAELVEAIKKISPLHIVGADLNELSPHYDPSGASTMAACKALRELLVAVG